MFDMDVLPPVSEVTGRDTAGLIEAMGAAARWEAATAARRLAAVAELFHRRLQEVDAEEREQWLIDGHEQVSAEVGCALGISRARAAGVIRVATSLFERLPKVAAVFAAGRVDYRVVAAIVSRTELVLDDADVAVLDRALARQVHRWNRLSRKKLAEVLDACVLEIDRLAAKPARDRVEDREVGIGAETEGTAELWGTLAAPDAIAFDTRLEQLAATVCAADPRTKAQRRADAVGALSVGATRLACRCGQAECPTAGESAPAAPEVVITVLTDPAGQRGYIPGFGFLDAQALAAAMAAGAQQRSLPHPGDCGAPEPRYRPSAALANFVRARDLTCRFPGCEARAEVCDIDHTVPWPQGPTHASNLKLLCRAHHLLKTFYTGSRWWSDRQLPNGTVLWTAPTGHTYVTKPHGGQLFPVLARPTGVLDLPAESPAPFPGRGHAMPTRRITRAQDRAARITYQRNLNAAHYAQNPEPPPDPPPF